MSLCGDWAFRLHPSADHLSTDVADPGFDDRQWERVEVPCHWPLLGDGEFGRPIYTNVQFPFPIDPPHVPDANPTADHRRHFDYPGWDVDRVLLRFDGVESVYRVWLNGTEVGVGKGSRLVQEFDVTDAVRVGDNVVVVRVHQWSSMSYVEDQDQWWLPGIFRDVTLLGRPAGRIDDIWLQTGYRADGTGWLRADVRGPGQAFPVTVEIPELGFRQEISNPGVQAAVDVGLVEPWSAEAPRLYDTAARASGETVSLRLGFRTVEIVGDRLLVNHRPVVFRGVNRHETNPIRGRVYERENALADMRLMKQHNVNAIRTSHYPPHPEVLELADELGFWVIDECDLETHGFVFVGWRGNPSDDPRFEAVYLDRIERTVERDKNHPCVIIWSLGNEAGTGRNLELMTHWVHGRDPERPVHYEGDYRARYTDIYSRMYPNLEQVRAIAGSSGAVPNTGPGDAVRVRTKPLILCEYAHAMGNGPGAFADYDELVEEFPRYHGGFVWEWRDHGLLTHTGDGTAYYGYGGDFGEVVHDGNFVMDGLVLPDGTPTPSLAEFAAVNAPIVFSSHGGRLTVRSRFHSRTTAGLQFWAAVEVEGNQQARTDLLLPAVEPGGSVAVDLPPDLAPAGGGEAWLTVTAALAEATPWAPAGHVIAWQQFPLAETETAAPQLPPPPAHPTTVDDVVLGPARFRGHDGALLSLHGVEVSGPHVELWRGPTDNDRSGERGSFELGDPADTGGEGLPGPSSDRRWRVSAGSGSAPSGHPGARCARRHGQVDREVTGRGGELRLERRSRLSLVAVCGGRAGSHRRGQPLTGMGLHLATGQRTVRPACGLPGRRLVRHGPPGVVPGQPLCRPGRPLLRRHRRVERALLPAPGDGPPQRGARSGGTGERRARAAARDLAGRLGAPPRFHADPGHPARSRSGAPPVRTRRPARPESRLPLSRWGRARAGLPVLRYRRAPAARALAQRAPLRLPLPGGDRG
jgi:beta-galactosidase